MKYRVQTLLASLVLSAVFCLTPGCDREPNCCEQQGATVAQSQATPSHGATSTQATPAGHGHDAAKVSKQEALAKLKDGNARYVAGNLTHPNQNPARRMQLASGQSPFAVVLGCADSRTSPEVVFDQGLGDLFVIRVAGNMADDHGTGSIEYAVEHLGSRLIVVLGHKRCGAVKAARDLAGNGAKAPGKIGSLVDAIRPAYEATKEGDLEATVKANVKNVVKQLREAGPILKEMVEKGELGVVGGYYDLDTGTVTFLD